MHLKFIFLSIAILFFSGCASVPMESEQSSLDAKRFESPGDGLSGLYIYRSGHFGASLKKDIWVDGKCIGQSAPNVFFYETVNADEEHKISTESEFSPNDVAITTESGKNYFIQQYIKLGLIVGGAGLKVVDESKGKEAVQKLKLAIKGTCQN